ncbi:type 1 fimbrial protein [Salmonella enterica]|nr:type 1 fimbrial protein [Salmonella enterica]EBD4898151.1 type 1 fimbrial protein [Salmonella enterica]ECW1489867.1 type 1 fimbrial protein [Salmonella enterica]
MKKSMAGTLLLAGLMMSAGTMAASGDPVQGGSGSVTINVPIVTSTCSVTVPTEVNFDPVDKNSIVIVPNRIIDISNMYMTLSHCSGQTLSMLTYRHDLNLTGHIRRFNSGDPDHALRYKIYVPKVAEITNGNASAGDYWLADLDGGMILPT